MARGRGKNVALNVIAGFAYELIALICGLILPRLILSNFGSAYNGITQSITQFIGYIELMKSGIGGVTMAALYKPLAEDDDKEISEILAATQQFMRKITLIFLVFIVGLAIFYPFLVANDFEWWFSASLILIISISTFAQYYLGFTYQQLIQADQKGYIVIIMQIVTTILNTIVSVVLINSNCTIHIVKLGSALVNVISPVFFNWYVRKHYNIDYKAKPDKDKIPQRWDAAAHEIAAFICNNTDITVITVLAGVTEVSVYTVYNYVAANIKKIISKFSLGFGAAFGSMYAEGRIDLMKRNLGVYELIIYSLASVLYSTTFALIIPFVTLYTAGITDANYIRPAFAFFLVLANVFNTFRLPYRTIVIAIGRYKETRNGAIMEAVINVVVSVIFTFMYGIVGVAIGSFAAMCTRSYQFADDLSKNVIDRPISYYFKHVAICLGIIGVTYFMSTILVQSCTNWMMWLVYAVIITLFAGVLTLVTDYVFYKDDLFRTIDKVKGLLIKKA
ncbi:MAG: polysaccharide biosynthesis C-terminal domain-containing protein [Erysipelotrichaceae bacterium]|nr:polysaccharide biosynthesis C-terminal domain-containing protein [Erysipelotrichaceae bacterium]